MSDTSDVISYIGGGTGIVAGVVWLVKTLAGRVVQREDDDKRGLQAKLEEQQKAERSISESLIGLKHDMTALRSDLSSISRQFETQAASQDKAITGLRAEVKEELGQLEHRFKSDMQRMISAGAPGSRKKG